MIEIRTGIEDIDWDELYKLYKETGLVRSLAQKGDFDAIKKAFSNSYKVVTAWDNNRLIGGARLISDGICYAGIFDVGVHPDYQKKGIGRLVMNELQKGEEHLWFILKSTPGNETFYEKLGFKREDRTFVKEPK